MWCWLWNRVCKTLIRVLLLIPVFSATQSHWALFIYIVVYIEVKMDARGAPRLLINFDLTKHVFAHTSGPYAAKDLHSAFQYLFGWFTFIINTGTRVVDAMPWMNWCNYVKEEQNDIWWANPEKMAPTWGELLGFVLFANNRLSFEFCNIYIYYIMLKIIILIAWNRNKNASSLWDFSPHHACITGAKWKVYRKLTECQIWRTWK
jgi:hypothetical protein